ncbi:hypothetical membrane protein (DUF4405 domain) [Campylobacter iguaniorum]|uniref:Hypothetical membrane protein (DUF4405 domain) n=1 Tax=Campylobacter iguaniorum TaxID=1244531 RepID=A0A076F959_9BACT|nr:DUF4405 domain-containing protein [Campylobacter iguaniorum]AII14765.1 hypothetical membrane protein (DUF4405 domain) [Campylobacter iguaniorum]
MKLTKPIGTTATIVTFIVVGVTGVLMFFHLNNGAMKLLHEYVGLAMIVACIVHIIANLTLFKKYFIGKKLIAIAILLAISIVSLELMPNGQKPPFKDVYANFLQLSLSQAKLAFSTNEDTFNEFLNKNNLKFEDISVEKFVAKNNIKESDLVKILINK